MNLQRREEISALLAEPVTGEAGQALEYRDALMECRTHIDTLEQTAAERVIADGSRGPTPDYTGEGSAWVPPVEARAVVVQELTDEDYFRLVQSITCPRGTESVGQLLTEFIREHSRAIPADRVLGDGMVAVDSLLYAALINLEKAVVREWGLCCTGDRLWNGQKAIADRRDALRANQGGTNE